MAIAFVQDDHLTSSGVTEQAIAFTNNVAAGSAIVVFGGASSNTTISGITDTLGNTYARVVNNPNAQALDVWMAVNSGAGANTVTVTWAASNNPQTTIAEYSGVLTTSVAAAIDQTGTADSSAVTNHPCNASNLTPSEDNCLVVGSGRFGDNISVTGQETGFTLRAGGTRLACIDSIQTTATATDADFTTAATETGACGMGIIKSLVASAGRVRLRPALLMGVG